MLATSPPLGERDPAGIVETLFDVDGDRCFAVR